MSRPDTSLTTRQDRGRLSPCVCNTLRMVSRTVTQLYDDILRPSGLRVTQYSILATLARMGEANLRQLEAALVIDQTTLTRSLGLLERIGVIDATPRRTHQGDATHIEGEKDPHGRTAAVGPGAKQGAPRAGNQGMG